MPYVVFFVARVLLSYLVAIFVVTGSVASTVYFIKEGFKKVLGFLTNKKVKM